MTKRARLGFICLWSVLFFSTAHSADHREDLIRLEVEIASFFHDIKSMAFDGQKIETARRIDSLFQEMLRYPESFDYHFDSLRFVGKIYATDRQMRIYTWNIPLADGTHLYYGHVQSRQDGQVETFHLSHDRSEAPDTLSSYTDANWYGALYYEIIPISCEEKTHYTLLGLDLNNVLTNRKIIDVIRFENGRIFFGAPVFRKGSSVTQRVIFEYSSRVSMMMRYDTTRGMIVVDHLSPSDPRFEGAYQYYGPDFSYDGFRFADCQWNHVEDLDLRGR